jgi:hypothetical protein
LKRKLDIDVPEAFFFQYSRGFIKVEEDFQRLGSGKKNIDMKDMKHLLDIEKGLPVLK